VNGLIQEYSESTYSIKSSINILSFPVTNSLLISSVMVANILLHERQHGFSRILISDSDGILGFNCLGFIFSIFGLFSIIKIQFGSQKTTPSYLACLVSSVTFDLVKKASSEIIIEIKFLS
jgi:hypothetical protein